MCWRMDRGLNRKAIAFAALLVAGCNEVPAPEQDQPSANASYTAAQDRRADKLLKIWNETKAAAPLPAGADAATLIERQRKHQLAEEGLDAIDPLIVELAKQKDGEDQARERRKEIDALVAENGR